MQYRKLRFALILYSYSQSIFIYTCMCSGTERQNVADDYAKRLHIGQVECEALVADVTGAYVSNRSHAPPPKFQTCQLLNVSICPATEQGNVSWTIIIVY